MSCYTVQDVCQRLQMSRQTFYRQEATLRQRGILVELLPRIGLVRRFAAAPIDDYLAGRRTLVEVRRAIGGRR